MNILIVKLSALGDVTHALPALTTLRRQVPSARIAWLVEEPASDILRGHPALDRLLVWRRATWKRLAREGRWIRLTGEVRRMIREVRDTRYDLVIDLQSLMKSALWVAVARGVRKAGYGPGLRRNERAWWVLNERVKVADPDAHAVERNLRLLEGLGFARLPLQYDFPIGPEDDAESRRILSEIGIENGKPFIAINPMTRWETKNWAPAPFAAVGDGLIERGYPVVWTGAPGDREAIDDIVSRMKRAPGRADGRTNLKALAALCRRAAVVLSTDTGPMHIAAAVGTPVVALFGPTSPGYTGPYGEEHVVLGAGVSCSPCYRRVCTTTRYEKHACMLRLKPAEVIQAVIDQARRRTRRQEGS